MKKLFLSLNFILTMTVLQSLAFADMVLPGNPAQVSSNFSQDQKKQIEQITHDYIVNNPYILIEASKKLQDQAISDEKKQIVSIKDNIPKYKNQIFKTKGPGRVVIGNPNGKIIIAEFTQHQCHHCKTVSPILDKLLADNSEIQLITIYWPFFGNHAVYSAKAALAAQKQRKFEEVNHALITPQELVTKNKTDTIVKKIPSLDCKKLFADMADKELEKALKVNFQLAKDLNLIGTPTLIFTNRAMTKFSFIPGQTSTFEEDLAKAIKEVS